MATRYRKWVPRWMYWLANTFLWRIVLEEYFEPKYYSASTFISRSDIERQESIQ